MNAFQSDIDQAVFQSFCENFENQSFSLEKQNDCMYQVNMQMDSCSIDYESENPNLNPIILSQCDQEFIESLRECASKINGDPQDILPNQEEDLPKLDCITDTGRDKSKTTKIQKENYQDRICKKKKPWQSLKASLYEKQRYSSRIDMKQKLIFRDMRRYMLEIFVQYENAQKLQLGEKLDLIAGFISEEFKGLDQSLTQLEYERLHAFFTRMIHGGPMILDSGVQTKTQRAFLNSQTKNFISLFTKFKIREANKFLKDYGFLKNIFFKYGKDKERLAILAKGELKEYEYALELLKQGEIRFK